MSIEKQTEVTSLISKNHIQPNFFMSMTDRETLKADNLYFLSMTEIDELREMGICTTIFDNIYEETPSSPNGFVLYMRNFRED